MTPEAFLAEFGHFADAPNGVRKLRELILQLAVQGKLVPQDPGETGAETLICEAKEKKQKLVNRLGLRRQGALQPLTQDGQSYHTPASWSWVRVDDVFLVTGGIQKSPKRKPLRNHFPYLRVANVQRGRLDLGEIARFELATGELEKLRLEPKDLLIVEGNGSEHEIGRCAVWSGEIADCVHQNHLIRCRPIYPEWSSFILLFLNAPQGIEEMKRLAITTSGLYNLSVGKIRGIACPIPPPQEQKRIVAKVDQLMALCDELEARKQQRREARVRLNDAALDALLNATDPDDFAAHWQRIGDHFDLLYDHPESIARLRAAILQLAVQGKLVPQNPGETNSEDLVREANKKKQKLADRLGLRRQVTLQPLTQHEQPYQAPTSWTWARMDDVFLVTGGIQKSPKRKPVRNHYPYLRVANVQRGRLDLGEIARFELAPGELKKLRLEPYDLLIVEGNGSEHEIGRCAVWSGEIADCVHQNHLIRCRPIYPQWSAFILLFLNAPQGIEEMKRLAITTSGLYNLSVGKIRGIACPIPPPQEQKRIVAKANQLMALCDELEGKLNQSQEQCEKLMEATVRQFVGQAPKPVASKAPARPKPPKQPPLPTLEPAPRHNPRTAYNGNIPQAILDHMQPGTAYSRADVVDALGISTGDWNWAIQQLSESGKVERTGQRRGARYTLIGP